MFKTIYKITSPEIIEEFIDIVDYDNTKVLVKVEYMAICRADIRYYLGSRDKLTLDHKYPLAPIHEAVGRVIKDPTHHFKAGDKVILVPNSVDKKYLELFENQRCSNKDLGINYATHSTFRSSSADGFMTTFVALEPELLVKYDDSVPAQIAVFSELLSVAVSALRRIDFSIVKRLAIFGDGILGYITYIVLSYDHPDVDVTLFGVNDEKMKMFKNIKTTKVSEYRGDKFDTLIEIVGGKYAGEAINSMIDLAAVGADLLLMGVSEDKPPLNTRLILEKGLVLKGATRSTYEDFKHVAELLKNKRVQELLFPMVLSITNIDSIVDIYKCFDLDINNRTVIGKHIMKW